MPRCAEAVLGTWGIEAVCKRFVWHMWGEALSDWQVVTLGKYQWGKAQSAWQDLHLGAYQRGKAPSDLQDFTLESL